MFIYQHGNKDIIMGGGGVMHNVIGECLQLEYGVVKVPQQ